MNKENFINISWSTFWRLLFFVLIVVILYLAREAIAVLLVSTVISLGLEPVVGFFEKKRIPRLVGIILVFLFVFLILVLTFYLLIPIVIHEIGGFFEEISQIIFSIFGLNVSKISFENFKGGLVKALEFIQNNDISISNFLSSAFNKLVLVVATILVTFYLLAERDGVERFLKVILPDTYERLILTIFGKFKVKIRRWLLAQLLLSAVVGILTGFGAWLLGIKYPVVIGLLAAIFEIVPVIGPVFVGIIAFFIAISDSLLLGIYAVAFFTLIQQFESHVLTPIVVGKAMKIHPVLVIISLIAGAHIAGFVGVLLAVPIAVALQEIMEYLAESKSYRSRLDI